MKSSLPIVCSCKWVPNYYWCVKSAPFMFSFRYALYCSTHCQEEDRDAHVDECYYIRYAVTEHFLGFKGRDRAREPTYPNPN